MAILPRRPVVNRPPMPRAPGGVAGGAAPPPPRAPNVGSRVSPGTVPGKKAIPAKGKVTVTGGKVVPTKQVTINPVIPKYVPGALDADAQSALGNLHSNYRRLTGLDPNGNPIAGAIGSHQYDRDSTLRDVARNRLDSLYNRDRDLEDANSSAAGRGIFNSGIRLNDRNMIAAAAQRILDDLATQEVTAENIFQSNMNAADSDLTTGTGSITRGSDDRSYTNWLANQPTPPAPINKKIFTYPQWLEYHKQAKTNTKGWDLKTRYNNYIAAHSK